MAKPLDEWIDVFAKLDCCVEPVLSLDKALAQAWVTERNMLVDTYVSEGGGSIRQVASALPFKRAKHQAGRRLGQDTRQVLESVDYTNDQIESLIEQGVLL